MDKCWFVLRQAHYAPPEYTHRTKALGQTTSGDLRLGDAITGPTSLFPILTQGKLPDFPIEMRIATSRGSFDWESTNENGVSSSVGAGAPIAAAVGITLGAEFSSEFKKATSNWGQFEVVDTETVQPSQSYINALLELPGVQKFTKHQQTIPGGRWSVYVITGLMIARAGGKLGRSEARSRDISGGLTTEASGMVDAKLGASQTSSTEHRQSAGFEGDRVWAVRLAKIHKGFLGKYWMQTEEKAGATLGVSRQAEEVRDVLKSEDIIDLDLVDVAVGSNDGEHEDLTLVKGCL